jgi:hypothetical protein
MDEEGTKITDLTELTESASNDLLVIVDKDDTTMGDSGTDKKIQAGNLIKSLLDLFYPVGTVYTTTSSDLDTVAKMNSHFGGTWESYGSGRVLVAKSTDTEFDTIGETGGVKNVTLTSAQSGLPAHSHSYTVVKSTQLPLDNTTYSSGYSSNNSGTGTTNTGNNTAQNASQAHTNLQPYIVVYRYRRTA